MTKCKLCAYKSPATQMLKDDELELLGKGCAEVLFRSGENIVKQNALSTNVAYLKSGVVKIHMTEEGGEKIKRIIKGPRYLCLPSNFSDRINHFSATALENSFVCFLDLETFKSFFYKNGDFAFQIIKDLSQNEIKNFHSYINSNKKQSIGRIAESLLFFYKEIYQSQTFTLPISRQELGEYSGTTRENASRILTSFHTEKIIDLNGKIITILNEALLIQISNKG